MLRGRGYTVTGSDSAAPSPSYTDSDGISIFRDSAIPEGATLAVYSLAIADTDPAIDEAQRRGIPLISRAQLLGAIMSIYPVRISVSGSHGKSTTTAIIERIFTEACISHTALSGAKLDKGRTFTDSGGDYFITEACEYKDSFLCLSPTYQIIGSVELDHTDYFESIEHIRTSFLTAASMADTVLINIDDPVAASIRDELTDEGNNDKNVYFIDQKNGKKHELSDTPPGFCRKAAVTGRRIVTYGTSDSADYVFRFTGREGEKTHFTVTRSQRTLELTTTLMGDFNLYNLTAAIALADTLGIDEQAIARAVFAFRGIERRLSLLGRLGTVPIYYDYAHHPSEISSAISALKDRYATVTVIFRPHTYSRTASLWRELAHALSMADSVILLDIFAAREQPMDGVDSLHLAAEIDGAIYSSDPIRAAELATGQGMAAIVLMGAGDVEDVKRELERLCDGF